MRRHPLFHLWPALCLSTGAAAQLPDPMRPADLQMAPSPAGTAAAPVESGVQMVIVRPGGKSTAVINGQLVAVGDKLGDKRVLKITETEVVLKGDGGRESIKATPAIEKLPVRKVVAGKPRAEGRPQ